VQRSDRPACRHPGDVKRRGGMMQWLRLAHGQGLNTVKPARRRETRTSSEARALCCQPRSH
jgi:hypothetical protein